jgi:DNA-binding response OmpR family regulator
MQTDERRVLVVEDDPGVGSLLIAALQDAGFGAQDARTVGEAWREINERQPIAAIVDIKLPAISGWELIDRIRNDSRLSRTPVVVISGDMNEAAIRMAEAAGCEWVAKPFDSEEVVQLVAAMVSRHNQQAVSAVRVVVLTDIYVVEGNVHMPVGVARFSDALEIVINDERVFIPLTDAQILGRQGGIIAEPPFMQVNKHQIRGVYPVQEP